MTPFSPNMTTDLISARNLNALASRAPNRMMSLLIKIFSSQSFSDFMYAIGLFFACLRTNFTMIGRHLPFFKFFKMIYADVCLRNLVPHFNSNINNFLVYILVGFFFHSEYSDIMPPSIVLVRISVEKAGKFTNNYSESWDCFSRSSETSGAAQKPHKKGRFMNPSGIFWEPGRDPRHTALSVLSFSFTFNQV